MLNTCILITKTPHSAESAEHICGITRRAIERDIGVTIYLLGDGVFCAKKNQKGYIGQNLKTALESGVIIRASSQDLFARAISPEQVEPGVHIIEDLEDQFVEDIMENADRVISW